MNDFLNGYSQGVTGSTKGLPSQSVMEAMGRDAARNQSNNTPRPPAQGGKYSSDSAEISIPVTTLIYQAGKKMTFKNLARHFAISVAIIVCLTVLSFLMPKGVQWIFILPLWASTLWMFWTVFRSLAFLIARIGMLFERPAG